MLDKVSYLLCNEIENCVMFANGVNVAYYWCLDSFVSALYSLLGLTDKIKGCISSRKTTDS